MAGSDADGFDPVMGGRGRGAESAGILMYRRTAAGPEVLIVHPGGPYWQRRDVGAWSIPKGELARGEAPEFAARREFAEELGVVPIGRLDPLGSIRQKAGKLVHGFALEGDLDPAGLCSNEFEIEWPPRSGRKARFTEVDRAEWVSPEAARQKLNAAQAPFLDRLVTLLGAG